MTAAEKPRLRYSSDGVLIGDGLQNIVANLGTSRDKASHTVYVADNLTSDQLVNMYRTSWLAAAICDYPAEDATRKWRSWRADADQITKIEAEEKRLGLQHKVQEALIAARLLGGSAIYISAENQDPTQPLKPGDRINSLILMGKDELSPGEIVRDINSPYYGKPEFYEINSNGQGARATVHASRFAIFTGRRVPGSNVYTNNGPWGDSALQSTLSAIKSADTSVANIASLIFEANVDVMKVQGFAELLAQHQDELILRRARLQAAMKGINGMLMIDAQDDYEKKSAAFSGLESLMAKFFDWVSGAARIPVTRLFGRAAAALSGSGDGDERVYYDRIADIQCQDIGQPLALLDECIITQALGDRPAEIYYEWAPLRQKTETENAEIFSKYATAARSLAGQNAGEIVPLDALSDAMVNALTESGALPGLEGYVQKYGTLGEQSLDEDIGRVATPLISDYDPNQPRDKNGRWTSGASSPGGAMPPVPDGHVRLYHGSNESNLGVIENKGVFGGVFASESEASAESHMLNSDSQLYYVDIKESDILRQRDLDYEIEYDIQVQALKKSMHWLDDDDIDMAYEIVIEQKDVWDRDWDEVERIFPSSSDLGEASWEGQRIRGKVAKELGFKAVEMDDEHGTSVLILPGEHLKKVVREDD